MSDKYQETIERLWEKLEFHKDRIDTDCLEFPSSFPIDDLTTGNPFVRELIKEVEGEYNYGMSVNQGNNAVMLLLNRDMEEYNKKHGTNLKPRR